MMCRFDGPKELTTMLGLAAGEPILAARVDRGSTGGSTEDAEKLTLRRLDQRRR